MCPSASCAPPFRRFTFIDTDKRHVGRLVDRGDEVAVATAAEAWESVASVKAGTTARADAYDDLMRREGERNADSEALPCFGRRDS